MPIKNTVPFSVTTLTRLAANLFSLINLVFTLDVMKASFDSFKPRDFIEPKGIIRVEKIDPGNCTIRWINLDQEAVSQ